MGNKKKTPKAKEPIKLRYKRLANGNQSIYLDYYSNGKREYEFLKLYRELKIVLLKALSRGKFDGKDIEFVKEKLGLKNIEATVVRFVDYSQGQTEYDVKLDL